MILHEGMRPAWFGLVIGVGLSPMTARLLLGMVPFQHHVDVQTYYVAVPVLIVVTLIAAFVPARRAARVNPTAALRCE